MLKADHTSVGAVCPESGSPPAWNMSDTRERGCWGRAWDAGLPPRASFVPALSCGLWLHCLPLCPALLSSVRAKVSKVSKVPARNVSMGPALVAHSLDPWITLEKAAHPLLRTQNLLKSLSTKEALEPVCVHMCVSV